MLTFLNAEPGIETLDALFRGQEHRYIISYLTLYEIYTTTFRNHSKTAADFLLKATLQLGLDIDYDNALDEITAAGVVRGAFPISAMGAWIASLAFRKGAALVHKDPAFESLKGHIDLLSLSGE